MWLTMDATRAAYAHTMKPVNSEEYWEPTDAPRPLPPPIKRPAHRPKVKRRIDPVETEMNPNKAKAKKNKKKLPRGEKKTSDVGPEGQLQEIPLSQNAPQSEEVQHATNSGNIQQSPSNVAFTTQSNPT
ncbi:hypothetical protein AHAS_Ahas03G0357600 [Arachis hypogaea]